MTRVYENKHGRVVTDRKHETIERFATQGPLINAEFADMNYSQRAKYNVHKLDLRSGTGNSESIGRMTAVYFIPELHTPKMVLDKFLDVNPHICECSADGITEMLGFNDKALADVWVNNYNDYCADT